MDDRSLPSGFARHWEREREIVFGHTETKLLKFCNKFEYFQLKMHIEFRNDRKMA